MITVYRRDFLKKFSLGVIGTLSNLMIPDLLIAASISTWRKIYKLTSRIGKFAASGNQVISLIQNVKELLSEVESEKDPQLVTPLLMQPFRPVITDTYNKGRYWLPEIKKLAEQYGNPWVPRDTRGLSGINLTGIWVSDPNWREKTYIRQFGPYLNFIGGITETRTWYAEGLFDPHTGVLHVVGQFYNRGPFEIKTKLYTDWSLHGEIWLWPGNELKRLPINLFRIA